MVKKSKVVDEPIQYAFPRSSRCPRCGTTQTRAYATRGQRQYRECLAAICRHRYTVRAIVSGKTT